MSVRGWFRGRAESVDVPPGVVLGHGELRLLVLNLLAERPRTSTEIQTEVSSRLAATAFDTVAVIDVVDLLDRLDYVRLLPHGRAYMITEDGMDLLLANRTLLDVVHARLSIPEAMPATPEDTVLRSVEGLVAAVRLRLMRGNLSDHQGRQVARAINAVARGLECA